MTLHCETLTGLSERDRFWSEWEELLERARPEHRLFTPHWYTTWSETLGASDGWTGQLSVIAVRDQLLVLRGVLALAQKNRGPLGALSFAGGWQPWRTIVSDAGLETQVGQAIGRYVAQSNWNMLRVGPCVASCPITSALVETLDRERTFVHLQRRAPLAICNAPKTWDEYRKDVLGGKFFRKLGYYERRTAKAGEMRIEHLRQPTHSETTRMIDDLGTIEGRSWLAGSTDGHMRFVTPADRQFWARLIDRSLSPNDQIDCWIMHLDGRPISFCFTLTALPVRYVVANHFDEEFKNHRTGSTLYRYMMEDGINRGVRHFDFGDGELHYKKLWGAAYQTTLDSFLVVPNASLGFLASTARSLTRLVKPKSERASLPDFDRPDPVGEPKLPEGTTEETQRDPVVVG